MTVARRDLWWVVGAGLILAVSSLLAARHRLVPGESVTFRLVNDLPPTVVDPVKGFMMLGTINGVVIVAVVLGVLTRRIAPVLAVLGAALVARAATPRLKDVIERGRPGVLMDDVNLRQEPGGFGFPSGHTSVAFAAAVVIAWCFPKVRWPVLAIAALVGVARMYVGVHLPLDLVGGAVLGLLIAVPFVLVLSWVHARRGSPRAETAER
jgi:glycosyltransferase 2 family protein